MKSITLSPDALKQLEDWKKNLLLFRVTARHEAVWLFEIKVFK